MKKLFVPHKISILLRELGYDEECFTYWNEKGKLVAVGVRSLGSKNSELSDNFCSAPLYQQVIDWLITNYRIFTQVTWYPQIKSWIAESYFMDSGNWITTEKIKNKKLNRVLDISFFEIIEKIKKLEQIESNDE